MKKVENILIVYNTHNEQAVSELETIKSYLDQKGISQSIIAYQGTSIPKPFTDHIDMALTLGGDGTFLYCAGLLAHNPVPILTINAGHLGFITESGIDEWQSGMENYLNNCCHIQERIILQVKISRNGKVIHKLPGVNEMAINSRHMARIVSLSLSLPRADLGQVKGDGLLISTPTGSTGYSLAAGGPILSPQMDAFILTPICPFSLSYRPLVFSGDEIIKIVVNNEQRTGLAATLDGHTVIGLEEGDCIEVSRSNKRLQVILSEKRNFFEVVRMKLGWSGDFNA